MPNPSPLTPLVETLPVGDLTVHLLQAGGQKLDGGAMFGVVPKPLWERRIAADARNRIQLGMRCLLVEHPREGLVLIDTGMGDKEDAKFHDIYGVENAGTNGGTALDDALAQLGHRAADVRLVIDTHLHFDHAGGNTRRDESGAVVPAFPNARYVVQRGEWEYATHPNERTAGSYLAHNFRPIHDAGRFELVDDERELVPGIHLLRTPGHTPHHQSVLVQDGQEGLVFLADLCPTAAHVPLAWIMGYDVEPLVTLESRRRLWDRIEREGWRVCFEHDAVVSVARLARDGKGWRAEA